MRHLDKRVKVTSSQFNRMSEIFGNISVAWFVAGVITPLFNDFLIIPMIISIVASGFFFSFSILFTRK